MKVHDFRTHKEKGEKISVVTCYDASSAKILNATSVDAILVGDSLAMTMYGEDSTLPATVELMVVHTRAVARHAPNKFIIADMPFMSYRMSLDTTMSAVRDLMAAGAHAIKLEGVKGNEELIEHIVASGVPVMGHLGLTPQSVHQLGGYRVQGKSHDQAEQIYYAALELEKRGCFSVVLECVPSGLARRISENLKIPTIGIGAGPDTDGQVLVWHDLLGLNTDFKPKFVREYLKASTLFTDALNQFAADVRGKKFPAESESYE